jgi:hypothetical protein
MSYSIRLSVLIVGNTKNQWDILPYADNDASLLLSII